MTKIIYPNGTGVTILESNVSCGLTIEQIAAKDVPMGTPFLIVDTAEISTDRTYRDSWTADFSNPAGYGGN